MAAPLEDVRREREDLLRLAVENDDTVAFLLLPKFGTTTYDPDLPKFHLDSLTNEQCRSNFRFDKEVGP